MAEGSKGDAASRQEQYPKGVVLGPDGKPCRACSSGKAFSAWAAQAKKSASLKGSGAGVTGSGAAVGASVSTSASSPAAMQAAGDKSECPADVETLGRAGWTLLHTMAAYYPEKPTPGQQADMAGFVKLFAKLYPCRPCAEDFQRWEQTPGHGVAGAVGSREDFGQWLCRAHNEVNRKLGKEQFDCSRWLERWRDGWKDGRCD